MSDVSFFLKARLEGNTMQSPADIYHHFVVNKGPPSILKSPSLTFPTSEPETVQPTHTVVQGSTEVLVISLVHGGTCRGIFCFHCYIILCLFTYANLLFYSIFQSRQYIYISK